jgi:hypothetical protein
MNRALVYELATGRFIAQREDASFSARPILRHTATSRYPFENIAG